MKVKQIGDDTQGAVFSRICNRAAALHVTNLGPHLGWIADVDTILVAA